MVLKDIKYSQVTVNVSFLFLKLINENVWKSKKYLICDLF